MGGNEKGFKGTGGKGTRRQLGDIEREVGANEKGFKGAGAGGGDQEATGRE